MLRSILAIIVGYIVIALLTTVTFFVVGFVYPSFFTDIDGEISNLSLVVSIITGFIFAIIGAYITAWIARDKARNALVGLAILIIILWFVSFYALPDIQPLWYELGLLAASLVGIYLGGVFRKLTVTK